MSLHIQSFCGIPCGSVYVRDSLSYSSFNFSKVYRSGRAAQIVARRFQAHSSTFEKLSVELRGHLIPEPRSIPFIRVPVELAALFDSGGLSGTAYPSEHCTLVLLEITADLESQLEIVSDVPGESIRFSSDARLLRLPSLVCTAAWDERCSGVEERCALSPPGSAEVAQAPAMLGIPAFLRKSGSSALHETRTLLGAGASISRTRPPVTPTCAVTSKSAVPPRQPLDLAEVLAKLATVQYEPRSSQPLEEEFGVDMGRSITETKYSEVLYGGGSGGRGLPRLGDHAPLHRFPRTRHECPGVIIAAHETTVREDLMTLHGESWSRQRHAVEYPLHHCGHLRNLRWVSVTVTGDLDEGRIGGFERPHAILCQIYGMLESVAKDSCSDCPTPTPDQTSTGRPLKFQWSSHGTGKRLRSRQQCRNTWNFPLLGLSHLCARPDVPASHSRTRTGEQRRKGQRRRAKLDRS